LTRSLRRKARKLADVGESVRIEGVFKGKIMTRASNRGNKSISFNR
jgi:hypothetical protein